MSRFLFRQGELQLYSTEAFGIERDEALSIVAEIEAQVLEKWRDAFYGAGFGDEGLRMVEHIFKVIPPADATARPTVG